ncbi:uncharacterized protein CBL_20007 [Carabus blaptoides fortunei]
MQEIAVANKENSSFCIWHQSVDTKIVEFQGGGPYVFKVHGQVYYRTLNAEPPTFAQLYAVDSMQATEFRRNHPVNEQCSAKILFQIDRFFRQNNRLADTYRMLRDVETQAILNANATACNRTYFGDVGKTYELELHRPREDKLPYICHLTFTANGGAFGDIVQMEDVACCGPSPSEERR